VHADAVGVDFGTATTMVAQRFGPAAATILPLGRSTTWIPSAVRVDGARLIVGEDADTASPEQVLQSVKRAITARAETISLPALAPGTDQPVELKADEAIAAVLREAVARARTNGVSFSGSPVVRLGCPAMWDGGQRRRLLDIATLAGLPVAESALVDEPVAAGVAWLGHHFLTTGERPMGRLLVFDMGGGTLDVAVLAVTGGPTPEIAVQACLGTAMAGDALDVAIAREFAFELAEHEVDLSQHPQPELAWALLERAARETKVRLSTVDEHPVVLPRQLGYPHVMRYRREQLESAFQSHMDGAENLVVSALRAARLAQEPATAAELRAISRTELAAGIDFVLLVGGMSRIPYVARRLATFFPRARMCNDTGVPPEDAVVVGLADPAGFERISLHRPGFDFVLDCEFGRIVAYEAYTPLYEPWQVYSGHSGLGYERRLRPPEVPTRGFGTLRAVSGTGEPLRMRLDGQWIDGLPVRLGLADIVFGLSCDGRIDIVDATGEATALRAEGWPVPGRDRAGPVLHRVLD
jgi:molecular chaperone DnaK (HSP70)